MTREDAIRLVDAFEKYLTTTAIFPRLRAREVLIDTLREVVDDPMTVKRFHNMFLAAVERRRE